MIPVIHMLICFESLSISLYDKVIRQAPEFVGVGDFKGLLPVFIDQFI